MIKKEKYKVRKDGVELFRIYSDIGHKIINKRTGIIYSNVIDIREDEEYEESEELVPEKTPENTSRIFNKRK